MSVLMAMVYVLVVEDGKTCFSEDLWDLTYKDGLYLLLCIAMSAMVHGLASLDGQTGLLER